MKIFMACPAPPRSRKGNRVTADRWARLLKDLSHRLTIGTEYKGQACELMVALHARKSYQAMHNYRKLCPDQPLVLCLTGTDLYRDIHKSKRARLSLEMADRLVLLQADGINELAKHLRRKARVIIQSAEPTGLKPDDQSSTIDVCVLGHLRHEKDPFRAAMALRLLPADIPMRVIHLGQALTEPMARRARRLMAVEPRYDWRGEVSRGEARRVLARSRLMVISSRMEGGANVICEALADHVPILASRMSGNIGLLGKSYPAYFPVGDTEALASLLHTVAKPAFYAKLKACVVQLAPMVDPARELASWRELIGEL